MSDTPSTLTPDEASAIEAIGGAPPAAASDAIAHDAGVEPVLHEEGGDKDAHAHAEHGNEGGALHSGDHIHGDAHDVAHDEAEHVTQGTQDAEMAEMKSTMLDSAELANRAAGMAAKAAGRRMPRRRGAARSGVAQAQPRSKRRFERGLLSPPLWPRPPSPSAPSRAQLRPPLAAR